MMLVLVLTNMLASALNIPQVRGWNGTIYIRADGSVDPPDAPVSSADNVTYVLADSILGSIVVGKDVIIIDGAGFKLQGAGGESRGVDLTERTNVTVQNMQISGFYCGIWLYDSFSNRIIRNQIKANRNFGIMIKRSSGNIIRGNNMTANNLDCIALSSSNYNTITMNNATDTYSGIEISESSYNNISGNNIRNNVFGIGLFYFSGNNGISKNSVINNNEGISLHRSSSNSFSGNIIANNGVGAWLEDSSGNRFYHNLFIHNVPQARIDPYGYGVEPSVNVWDDGYPSGGNYWSDYAGIDENKDGFGDAPYIIDAQNADRYPLMSSLPIADTGPPILSITYPYSGEVIRSSAVTISWEGVDYASGISHYTIAVDDGHSINAGLNTSYTFTELDDGQHVVRVAALDNAGNAAYQSVHFAINAGVRFARPPYMAEAVVTIAIVIALGAALYVLKGKYSFRIRKPSRKLIR